MKLIAPLIISLIALFSSLTVWADAAESAVETGDKPFVLIARLHALPNASGEVLRLSNAADEAVKASEPGMLIHTFDQDPSDPLGFVWTEVYANSAALIFHLENPPLQKYLADVSPLLDNFAVELYGEVSAEAVNMLRSTGTPTSHFQSKFGYVRDLTP
jgi:quinol monooxygenase YgiN